MTNNYNIYRYYSNGKSPRKMATGLTLDQAQKWCSDPETSSKTHPKKKNGCQCEWFDGYTNKY